MKTDNISVEADNKLKPCPFCGRKMVLHKEESINKNGKKVKLQYYMHEDKKAECVLDAINMPFVIGAGDATENYIGEYAELWNRRANDGRS